ncbi:MAG: hypothetical protein QOK15_1687 [Nocardioidaceae bacterium]|jgi:hypothetical protein|nr:hypothetical protein [Nocardioidaceae bacterium]
MRRYDDPVEVRKGLVTGTTGPVEGPEQFLWKGRLWKVRDVLAHWVETGPWWQSREVAPILGDESAPAGSVHDLLGEREVWRVEAARGQAMARVGAGAGGEAGAGVFDLTFDWAQGSWQLSRCAD